VVRPAVDVVVPYAGADPDAVVSRLRASLSLRPDDSFVLVDNRGTESHGAVLAASAVRTSYFARNEGASRGRSEWILFIDADVLPGPGLIDGYFSPAPDPTVGVLAGGIDDEAPAAGAGPAVRYAALKRSMSQETVLAHGEWAFAQTANAMVRRAAFEEIGGFRPTVRSGGDADLCWRLRRAGWELERRDSARVVHRSRTSLGKLLANRFRHGTGAGWLSREHPGALPARSKPGLAWWLVRSWASAAAAAARRDTDAALVAFIDPIAVWAFELGRLVPNRPLHRSGPSRRT
jgi:hypothetical protein